MAHHTHDREDANFEIASERRQGFPSETQVKRGVRIVHLDKELGEKVGRNDLCRAVRDAAFRDREYRPSARHAFPRDSTLFSRRLAG